MLRSGVDTLLIDDETGIARKIDFRYGNNTEVRESCGITWKNKHYIFGGELHGRQISEGKNGHLYLLLIVSLSFLK